MLEVALIDVTDGSQRAFADAYQQARALIVATPGCGAVRLTAGVESPTRFVLLVEWASLAAHEAFRNSERFGQWRALVGPHFAAPPVLEHFRNV